MTMFADARNDCDYNTDFLGSSDMEYIKGFDYALETITNLIENNLDEYESELSEIGEDTEDEVFAHTEGLYSILENNKKLLSLIISMWHEMERDELVASMIDNMDEEEYEKLKAEAIAKNGKQKYYDSRMYAVTGKKEFHEE